MAPDKSEIFISTVDNHRGIIYKIVNIYCNNDEDKKDLAQEIILQLWKSFDDYNNQYKYSTWIYRIALNVAISYYRKEKSKAKMYEPLSNKIFHIAATDTNTDNQEELAFFRQCLSEFKTLDKALILLYLEEKSHKEIAEIMGITPTNVTTKINRLKNVLKLKFSQKQI